MKSQKMKVGLMKWIFYWLYSEFLTLTLETLSNIFKKKRKNREKIEFKVENVILILTDGVVYRVDLQTHAFVKMCYKKKSNHPLVHKIKTKLERKLEMLHKDTELQSENWTILVSSIRLINVFVELLNLNQKSSQ